VIHFYTVRNTSDTVCNKSNNKLKAKDVLPNINYTQVAERAENAIFCPWWPWPLTWPSNCFERWTKHVFHVNLVQIHSAVPRIFHTQTTLEAKDVLANINHTQATKRPWWPWPLTLTFKLVRVRDQICLSVNLVQIHSVVPGVFHTQTKKQNLLQFMHVVKITKLLAATLCGSWPPENP